MSAAAIVRVRKVSAQTAHWSLSDRPEGAVNAFESTLCGRAMVLGEWTEVHDGTGWSRTVGHGPAFLLQPCLRCAAKLSKIVDEAHAEAIAEDAQRAVIAREYAIAAAIDAHEEAQEAQRSDDAWLIAATGEAHLIFLVRGAVRADTGIRIVQARTVCGITATGETRSARPPFRTLCLDCVEHDAQNGGTLPMDEEETSALGGLAESAAEFSSAAPPPTLSPDAYVIADYRDGAGSGGRHVVARIYGSDSGDSFRPADGARWSDDPYGDAAQYSGFQGSADTLCGTIAYGIMYAPHQGPAVDCQGCILRDPRRIADALTVAPLPEETSAPTADVYGGGSRHAHAFRPMGAAYRGCVHCGHGQAHPWHVIAEETSGPVAAAVSATSALLGADAGPHLRELYATVVVDTAAQDRIAAAYDALPLLPDHDAAPLIGHAWRAMAAETLAQGAVLRELGIRWAVVDTDPYSTAGELFAELRETGAIRVLSSRVTGGHGFWDNHTNDTFRAVHDILGHAATGRGFDRYGEDAAYQAHSVLYSPLARLALASETRGQNSSMLRAGGVFPPQRIGILPEWARATDALRWHRGLHSPEEIAAMRADAARDHAAQGLGTWNA